jgi:dTDP-4-amino-4,6-dideoxygalactose transaminase
MIPYINLKKKYLVEKKDLLKIIDKTLSTGNWVTGQEVEKFEKNIARLCKVRYCNSLNSGTDALTLALHTLGIGRGDEVITTPNSFIASTAVIIHLGAIPKFVDVQNDQNINPKQIENAITKKTKAIMPVHLCGRVSEMKPILEIAKKYNLRVIEDSAQAIGSKYYGRPAGSWGDAGCFSAHPLKNLNAMGDAGYLTTNNKKIFKKIQSLKTHGMENRNRVENFGYVSRMDNVQAAILNWKIKKLELVIKKRRENAKIYLDNLDKNYIYMPIEKKYEFHSYHTFVVQVPNREKLVKYLSNSGVQTSIHYPIPIHLQPAAKFLGYKRGSFPVTEKQSSKILTLPINETLSKKDILNVCKKINRWFKK